MNFKAFEFTHSKIIDRTIFLGYRLVSDDHKDICFEEALELPRELPAPDITDPVISTLLDGIHRIFGISYFKTFAPLEIIADQVSSADADFWKTIYTEGLGEFWYQNKINPNNKVNFPKNNVIDQPFPVTPPVSAKALVLVGGGKDSVVASEIVKHAKVSATAFTLSNSHWQRESIQVMGLKHLSVTRKIDPQLFELNQQGAQNGHIPISACIAFIATLVAYLAQCNDVIVANEHSANEINLHWQGLKINHQWSKSLTFERAFQQWCQRHFFEAPQYFSILRPLDELGIAKAFANHPQHFSHFTSCNRNFKQHANSAPSRWCGQCPKCIFSQLILSPASNDESIMTIFGHDFLSNESGIAMLEQLTGLSGNKPFDCVGTELESRIALAQLFEQNRMGQKLISWYQQNLYKISPTSKQKSSVQQYLDNPHSMPKQWEQRLYAYLGT